jgi:Rieske Fe-S protein
VKRIGAVSAMEIGSAQVFEYPGKHDICLLIRTGAQSYVAYNQKCTHLSCAVVPDTANGRLHCPCHNGFFELATGVPTAGPPRRPLERIVLEIRDGHIYAVGREVRA